MDLTKYAQAGFPFIYLKTYEIKRAIKNIKIDETRFEKFYWNLLDGLNGTKEQTDPIELLDYISTQKDSVFILENFSDFLDSPTMIQILLNKTQIFKSYNTMLVFVGIPHKFNGKIDKLITVLDFKLPSKEEFQATAKDFCEQAEIEYNESAANACVGLSLEEAENALALSVIENNKLEMETIIQMKREVIKKTGFMDFIPAEPLENIGGLQKLKDYIMKRKIAWEENSNKPKLRSILLCGVPGSGKSLFSKVLGSIFNWPVIALDIGGIKGSLVGETEKNFRLAAEIIDGCGNVIVQLEEIEKSFSNAISSLDSGVSAGMLNFFLTWTQESKTEKIIVATANDISALPTEMLRAGRMDDIFFVDFPNFQERIEIVNIMNKKWFSNLPTDENFIKSLEKWTGAEIENLAKDSHFENLDEAMENVPLIKNTKSKELQKLYEKCVGMRRANSKEKPKEEKRRLKINSSENLSMDELKQKIKRKHLLNLKVKKEEKE